MSISKTEVSCADHIYLAAQEGVDGAERYPRTIDRIDVVNNDNRCDDRQNNAGNLLLLLPISRPIVQKWDQSCSDQCLDLRTYTRPTLTFSFPALCMDGCGQRGLHTTTKTTTGGDVQQASL